MWKTAMEMAQKPLPLGIVVVVGKAAVELRHTK